MVVEKSFFLHAESTRLSEIVNQHLNCILEQVLVIHELNSFCLEVDDVNFTRKNVKNNNFLLVHLAEGINNIFVGVLIKYLSLGIEVYDGFLFGWFINSDCYECVVIGSRNAGDS